MRKIIVFILFLFIFNINIKAACNNKELLDNADKVNITVLPQTSEEKDYYFLIRVENIKENMALVISDNDTNESKTYRYSDTNEGTLELINNYVSSSSLLSSIIFCDLHSFLLILFSILVLYKIFL